MIGHKLVIRQKSNTEVWVSCECRWGPGEAKARSDGVFTPGNGTGRYEPFGASTGWQETCVIYNNGEHNGEFTRAMRIGGPLVREIDRAPDG